MPTIAEGIYPVPAILVCLICPLLLVNASDWFSLKDEFSSLALCMQTPFFCLLVLEPKWSQLMCQMANTYLLKHYFVHVRSHLAQVIRVQLSHLDRRHLGHGP